MRLERGSVGAGQGDVNKVLPGVQVAEGGGDVDREVVPLEAVLLSDAHDGGVCKATRTMAQHSGILQKSGEEWNLRKMLESATNEKVFPWVRTLNEIGRSAECNRWLDLPVSPAPAKCMAVWADYMNWFTERSQPLAARVYMVYMVYWMLM